MAREETHTSCTRSETRRLYLTVHESTESLQRRRQGRKSLREGGLEVDIMDRGNSDSNLRLQERSPSQRDS